MAKQIRTREEDAENLKGFMGENPEDWDENGDAVPNEAEIKSWAEDKGKGWF